MYTKNVIHITQQIGVILYPSSGLISCLSHESRSVLQDWYPKDSMHLTRCLLKVATADFRPYKALTITAVFLASLSNSGPKVVHTFFVTVVSTWAFKMLPDLASRSLRVPVIKAVLNTCLGILNSFTKEYVRNSQQKLDGWHCLAI